MGIGTEPLRKYGYSIIGTPAIGKKALLYENLTCTCTISLYGPEMIQFLYEGGGTKCKTFEWYFASLVEKMK